MCQIHSTQQTTLIQAPGAAERWLACHSANSMIEAFDCPSPSKRIDWGQLHSYFDWCLDSWRPPERDKFIYYSRRPGRQQYGFWRYNMMIHYKINPISFVSSALSAALHNVKRHQGKKAAGSLHERQIREIKERFGFPFTCLN